MHKTLILLLSLALACSPKQQELTLEEKLDLIHQNAAKVNPFETYADELFKVDCSQVDQMLYDIFEADQEVRMEELPMEATDHSNLIKVLSILKSCGLPKVNQLGSTESMNAIAYVLQHQRNQDISAYFLPTIQKGFETALFSPEIWARIIDRQLMFNGYKQVYGTNFFDGKLYELENPDEVQERRDAMGLGQSFETILDYNGLTLEEALADQYPAEQLQRILVKPN
ncbi:hypothetical protein [Reichenbachiella sp.]|uniref:hypothetical protein n=1 Tax=Reichenbachiella sp. TaxID=2184521 RepID=UPI003B5A345C